MGKCNDFFIRPSKRKEKITRQTSEGKAFEIAEEWAKKIKEYGVADRFGMELKKVGRYCWDVYLVDRSIPEGDKKNKKAE